MRASRSPRSLWLLSAVLATGCSWFDGLTGEPDSSGPKRDSGVDSAVGDGDGDGDTGMRPDGGNGRMDSGLDAGVNPVVDSGHDSGGEPPDASDFEPALPVDLTWHPETRRIAISDDSTAEHIQPRAWLLVHGTDAAPHRLVTKALDGRANSWRDTEVWSIESPPAAVSYVDDSMQHHQRAMFVRAGKLGIVGFDGDVFVSLETHEPSWGYELEPGGLGAIYMHNEIRGIPLLAVAAHASRGGTPGHFCVYSKDAIGSDTHCSQSSDLGSTADIVATKAKGDPCFFARSTSQGLLLITRRPDDTYLSFAIETPESQPIGASLAVYEGPDQNLADVIVVTMDGRAWHGSIDPEAISAVWRVLPPLPGGAKISLGEAAISAVSLLNKVGAEDVPVPTVFALGEDGRVYYTTAARAEDNLLAWVDVWRAQPELARGEKTLALGALTAALTPDAGLNLYMTARSLQVVGGHNATTLQDFVESEFGWDRSDHARLNAEQRVSIADVLGAEVSVATAADDAVAAIGLRGGPEPPFSIVLAGSEDNASSWHRAAEPVVTLPAVEDGGVPASALYPDTAYGGGLLHLVALEWDLRADCSEPATRAQRIVYRRAESARQLAQLTEGDDGLFVVAASSSAAYDRPAFAVTESASGPTAHVLFNDHEAGVVRYWQLAPGQTRSPTAEAIDAARFPIGWLDLVVSPYDQSVFAITAARDRIRICDIEGANFGAPVCVAVPLSGLRLHDGEIAFGSDSVQPQGRCAPVNGKNYPCFADGKPFSIAMSPRAANSFIVAYTAVDGEHSSIYFAYSGGGDASIATADWSAPERVHARNGTENYFDPEITVDAQDLVFVTYSSVASPPDTGHAAMHRAHQGLYSYEMDVQPLDEQWSPMGLPYDCVTQRWALGDYRNGDTIGGRSLHVARISTIEALRYETQWLTKSTLP